MANEFLPYAQYGAAGFATLVFGYAFLSNRKLIASANTMAPHTMIELRKHLTVLMSFAAFFVLIVLLAELLGQRRSFAAYMELHPSDFLARAGELVEFKGKHLPLRIKVAGEVITFEDGRASVKLKDDSTISFDIEDIERVLTNNENLRRTVEALTSSRIGDGA